MVFPKILASSEKAQNLLRDDSLLLLEKQEQGDSELFAESSPRSQNSDSSKHSKQTLELKHLPSRKHKFLVQAELDPFLHNKLAEVLKRKIDSCLDMGYKMAVCGDCGAVIKQQAFKLHCSIRYCPHCVEERVKHSRIYLNSYNIRIKRLVHFWIGFKPSYRLDKALKKEQEKIMARFYKVMEKIGSRVSAMRVFDLNKTEKGLRYHYHHAQLPIADIRKFIANCNRAEKIVKEKTGTEFSVHIVGYRPQKSLFRYFSKIMAGLYSDEKNHHSVLLKDLISLEDYAKNFFNVRSLVFVNKPRAIRRGKIDNSCLVDIKECPLCKSKNIWLIDYQQYVDMFGIEPPPPLDEFEENSDRIMNIICPEDVSFDLWGAVYGRYRK